MLTETPTWVALMTHAGAEALAARHLGEGNDPIECYLPMLVGRDRRRTRHPLVEQPMFPNYLFARINAKQIYRTRTTRGVVCIVSANHSIIPVPDRDIEAVRRFEAAQRKVHLRETALLVRGNPVTVTQGEFAGLQGTLVRDCNDGNFCVSIDVMNISLVTHLRRDEFRPAAL